jgi:ribonuclease HI
MSNTAASDDRVLVETLTELETSLWRAPTRNGRAYMDRILAPGCFEFGRSGRTWDRKELLKPVGTIAAVLPLPELNISLIGPTVALVTYTSIIEYQRRREYARRSSIWLLQDEQWRLRFHPGTPYRPDEQKAD